MGAEAFENGSRVLDPAKAFSEMVQQAEYDYGHSGYTGTIAEKPGFTIRSQKPMTQEEADAFIDKDKDNNDKWGDAFAVPLCKEPGGPITGWVFYGWASS